MPPDIRPAFHFALRKRGRAVLFVLLAASVAAVIAHVGIDVLGDYLLPHDTYDDIAHGSRGLVSCAALTVFAGAMLRLLSGALEAARTGVRGQRACSGFDRRAACGFFTLCMVATFGLLVGMESIDLAVAGLPPEDAGDLLGGSLGLGIAVALPVALAIAAAAWRLARWATLAQANVIGAICALLTRLTPAGDGTRRLSRLPLRRRAHAPALARSTSKRGPPAIRG